MSPKERTMKNALLALAIVVTAQPVVVCAHHSFASEFDANQPISLKGNVTKVEFINPHSWIHIEVTSADGTKAQWEVEGGTPNTLFRKGINDNTLPVGTAIAVDGYRARDGSNRMSGRDITLADGKKVFLSGSAPQE
jgi:hypothetical protein